TELNTAAELLRAINADKKKSSGAPAVAQQAKTPVEGSLTEIWEEVLGLENIALTDDFFELGGDSLLATQVVSRMRQVWKVQLPLRSLFESPTISGLATVLVHKLAEGRGDEMAGMLAELEESVGGAAAGS